MIDQGVDFPASFTSINQATEALEQSLTLRGKILIARSEAHQMSGIYFTLLEYVRLSLKLDEKVQACLSLFPKEEILKRIPLRMR